MSDTVKRQVALKEEEFLLVKKLSEGIGFSGYAASAIREKMVKDIQSKELLSKAFRDFSE